MAQNLTREYLEEALKLAKRDLPGWAFAMIRSEARARAGGRGRHRSEEPNAIEKLALVEIKPSRLREVSDADLRAVWLRLHQWHASAKRRKRAVEDIVNAALWVADEMERRKLKAGEGTLVDEIEQLRSVRKDQGPTASLSKLPRDLVVVRDFVSVVGSTAKGAENPDDLDVLVRAPRKDEQLHIQAENIHLPLRNVLDPGKEGKLHWIDNPQGAHGDHIPLYDLVMRRREEIKAQVVKASSSGLIAALWIPKVVADKIAIAGGEAAEDLHCTLAYFGKIEELPEGSTDRCIQSVARALRGTGKLAGKVAGVGRFNPSETSDGKAVVYGSLDVPGVASLRERIVREAAKLGLDVSKDHDFTPHVTLSYVVADSDELPVLESVPIEFDAVHVAAGEERREVCIKELRIDLGCGSNKPDGYTGIDKVAGDCVDIVHDLEDGIPLDDACADEVRACHFLEHVADKEQIMAEIHRVLKTGGRFEFEVPSTKGEGAFAHPGHKSLWNKSSFHFWAEEELREGRPAFRVEKLEEETKDDLCYVRGVLVKCDAVAKALQPFGRFTPPKPAMAGFTEAFEVKDLEDWAEKRWPLAVEPKHNGFRAILEKKGDRARLWYEGTPGRDRLPVLPGLAESVKKVLGDFVLDVDLAIERDGKRLPRPGLAKLNADEPELEPGEKLILTAFDLPFHEEDLTGQTFRERRQKLQAFFGASLRRAGVFALSPLRWVKSLPEMGVAARWAFGRDRSEGLVAKSERGKYELGGATNEWAKLKRVAELKVIVLDVQRTKAGDWNYWGGLAPSADSQWVNLAELGGKKYVNLGKTFSTNVRANKGDVLTVEVLELLPDEEKKRLAWLGARVIDVDETRKEPYATAQAIDITRRAKVLQKALSDIVPSSGPKGAPIAFVGASPGRVEAARGEPFVGPAGETFGEEYLKPLGLKRGEVVLTNAVPAVLTDEGGRVREPTDEEIGKWREWLGKELDRLEPGTVVALGQTAKRALGDRADFVLPHPSAIRRFGNKGEVGRKLKRIMETIRKQEEGETRGETAAKNWEENWHEMLPTSGRGRFSYMHHWIGLDEEETGLSESALFGTTNALHGDLRLEADDALWGWAIFLGKPADNRAVGGDKLFVLKPEKNLQGTPKLPQPKQWLNVGGKRPHVAKPGEPGAFAKTSAKFFGRDTGTYKLGVVRKHGVEIFLDGQHLKGRYLIQFAPVGGKRIWLIDKPADQTPMADKKKLADVIGELKRKGQRFLIWAKPGEKPQKIDVKTGRVVKTLLVPIAKADEEKQIVSGVVLSAYGKTGAEEDAHKDWTSPAEIERTHKEWFIGPRKVGVGHPGLPGYKPGVRVTAVGSRIEEYPSREDYKKAVRGEPHRVNRRPFGTDIVCSGDWVLDSELSDDAWAEFKAGKLNAYSIEGLGIKDKAPATVMPKVTFVDLKPVK